VPESNFLEIYIVIFVGLMLGSFATALSWRVARNQSWITGRSRCSSCNTALGFFDLVPLISWLAFRGRCRHCKASIGLRYPLIEAGVLACCIAAYCAWGFTAQAFLVIAAVPFLVAMLVIDLEQMILPDGLQGIVAALGFAFVLTQAFTMIPVTGEAPVENVFLHVGSGVAFASVVWIAGKIVSFLKKKEALGLGDVKFFAIAGLWLGGQWLPAFMVFSGISGLICGLAWRLKRPDQRFPFGPALIFAFYTCLLLQGVGAKPFFGL
jgi:prepilin signal peptidase PulO-like enzyme (type II secretory pathway)